MEVDCTYHEVSYFAKSSIPHSAKPLSFQGLDALGTKHRMLGGWIDAIIDGKMEITQGKWNATGITTGLAFYQLF